METEKSHNQTDFHASAQGAFHAGSGDINVWGSFIPSPTTPINGSNLPQRFANFVGRDGPIRTVLEALASRAWIITIDGMGGIGKTTLALEVAYRCRRREVDEIIIPNFTGYVWISARDKPNFGLADLVREINQTIAPHEDRNLTFDSAVGLTKRVLSAEPRLLIIDNFETVKDEMLHRFLRDELPDPSKVLITSRHHIQTGERVINLSGLSIEEAVSLLQMEAQRWNVQISSEDEPMLELMAQKAFGIPFVLKWVLENVYNGKSLEWALKALENATADDVFDYIFTRSLSAIDEHSRELFRTMAAFKAPVSIQNIQALLPHMPALSERIGRLVRLSLLEDNRRLIETEKRYWLHPFTRYLAERELWKVPKVQMRLQKMLANHFVMSASIRENPIFKDCSRLGIEADNYFEAIAWIQTHHRPTETTVWDQVNAVLEALRKCDLTTNLNRKELVAKANASIGYSRYIRSLLLTTVELSPLAAKKLEIQGILPSVLIRRDTVGSLVLNEVTELETGTYERTTTIYDLLKLGQKLVILGDSGSGKTTLLRYLAQFCGTDSTEAQRVIKLLSRKKTNYLVPIFISLHTIRRETDIGLEDILNGITEQFKEVGSEDLLLFVFQKMEEGRCLILFDGLDEVLLPSKGKLIRAIEGFGKRYPQNWIIITSRRVAYHDDFRDFLHLELQPLDWEQIKNFIKLAFDEKKAGDAFYYTLMSNTQIRELSTNPLLLSAMIRIYEAFTFLPARRDELFDTFIELSLQTRDKVRRITRDTRLPKNIEKNVLANLALQLLSEGCTTFAKEKTISLLEMIINEYKSSRLSDAEQILLRFTEAGILVEETPSSYRFLHLLLQEYLAAYALIQQEKPLEIIQKYINEPAWQEVLMLSSAIFERLQGQSKFEALLQSLIIHPDTEGRFATLAGQLLRDVGTQQTSTNLQQAVAKRLTQLINSDTPLNIRIEVASILGQVGDPRSFGDLVEIPAGLFTMGGVSQQNDTLPAHQVYLPTYHMGRYLVTNAEFAKFIEAGSYYNTSYWSANGWLYRQKEKWTHPNYWQNESLNQPNYPIVGVSFFEAMAYCRWLTEEWHTQGLISLDNIILLPTEAMWDKAAHSALPTEAMRDKATHNFKWPWGDVFYSEYANTSESRIDSTSVVGIFPEGASPYGILDMAGNVWEWCSSLYFPYPYNTHDGREDIESSQKRVLRGGSWTSHPMQSTSVYRHSAQPEDRRSDIGFRVVAIPKMSE
jgi:formylglycine-generating enzyme required for sulfatase activity